MLSTYWGPATEATLAVLHSHSFVAITGDTVERALAVIRGLAIKTRKHHCRTTFRAWRTFVARVWKMRVSRHDPGTSKESRPMRWGVAARREILGQDTSILRQMLLRVCAKLITFKLGHSIGQTTNLYSSAHLY